MRNGKEGWRAPFALSLAVLVASGLTGPAYAGDVEGLPEGEGVLEFTAEPGEENRLFIAKTAGSYRVIDVGAPLTALGSCVSTGTHEATCPFFGGGDGRQIKISLGDLDDRVDVGAQDPVFVAGEDGADTILVESFGIWSERFGLSNKLEGGAGDDTLTTGSGRYTVEGGEGDDVFVGHVGSGVLVGGPGADTFTPTTGFTISYSERTSGIVVDADGNADDGEPGENDNVLPGVAGGNTVIRGGRGDDHLLGGGGVDRFEGMAGNDVLDARAARLSSADGGPGDDALIGGPTYNEMRGGPGDDTLRGEAGGDRLYGGSGADWIVGGHGRDVAHGERGHDTLQMRDGFRDRVLGGHGTDRARVDRRLDDVLFVETLL